MNCSCRYSATAVGCVLIATQDSTASRLVLLPTATTARHKAVMGPHPTLAGSAGAAGGVAAYKRSFD